MKRDVYWWQDYNEEVRAERERGDRLHPGTEDLPDGTWAGGMRLIQREQAKLSCDRNVRQGTVTMAHVLEEEVCEALAEEDPVKLREELIQVAAVVAKWVRGIDRRSE